MSEEPKKPLYGEYAEDRQQNENEQSSDEQSTAVTASKTLPGVPHNLGVSDTPTNNKQVGASQTESVERPAVPSAPAHTQTVDSTQSPPASPSASPKPGSNLRTDRIITIVLLVLGALGAINLAGTAKDLRRMIYLIADAVGLSDLNIPTAIATAENALALTVLTIYALVLLFSVHRLRSKKITFWVPLVGAVLAFIVLIVGTAVAFAMVPDLTNSITPENFEVILDSVTRQ